MIYRTYKHNKKYICYIEKSSKGDFIVKTGKPSDITCLSWHYQTEFEAIATATECIKRKDKKMKKTKTIYYKENGEIDKMATFVNNNDGLMYLIFIIAMIIGCCDF